MSTTSMSITSTIASFTGFFNLRETVKKPQIQFLSLCHEMQFIVEINEITIRDFSLIEDEGIICLVASRYPNLSFEYEDDEEKPGKYILVIKGATLEALLDFLSFAELPVKVIT